MVTFTRVGDSAAYVENGDVLAARVVIIHHGADVLPDAIELENVTVDIFSFIMRLPPPGGTSHQDVVTDLATLAEAVLQETAGTRFVARHAFGNAFGEDGSVLRFTKYFGGARYFLTAQSAFNARFMGAGDEYRIRLEAPVDEDRRPMLAIAGSSLQIRRSAPQGEDVYFIQIPEGGNPQRLGPVIDGDLAIPLTGPSAGTIGFTMTVEAGSDGEDAVGQLRASMTAGFLTGEDDELNVEDRQFAVLRAAPGKRLRLRAEFDPQALDDQRRSFIAIEAPDDIFETTYMTTHGTPLQLRPFLAESSMRPARLYFFQQWAGLQAFSPRTSLLIDGDFEAVVPAIPDETRRASYGVICGLSEREYMPLRPGDMIAFRAGYDGYYGHRDVPPPTELAEAGGQQSEKTGKAQQGAGGGIRLMNAAIPPTVFTSWMAVLRKPHPEAATVESVTAVVSESRDFALFQPDATLDGGDASRVLHHSPLEIVPKIEGISESLLSPFAAGGNDPAVGQAIPMVPWQGFRNDEGTDDATLRRLAGIERDHLHARRRSLLAPRGVVGTLGAPVVVPMDGAASTRRYTPMGIEVEETDGRITKVILAGSTDQNGVELPEVALTNLSPELSDALQRSDLFLVIDRWPDGSFGAGGEPMRLKLSMRGWTVDIDLPKGGANPAKSDPVIIFKGATGALSDLIHRQGAYARPDIFLSGGADGIPAIAQKIEALRKRSLIPANLVELEKDIYNKYFQRIEELFKDPLWTGVLIYGVSLDPSALPDQITGLLAGSDDLSKLGVHHLGIDVRRLDFQADTDEAKRRVSPVFGLVSYLVEGNPVIKANESFSVSLNKLLIQFANSEVRHFEAEARLAIRHMFEGAICGSLNGKPAPGDPVIRILGSYERRLDNGRPVDVYSFTNEDNWLFDFNRTKNCVDVLSEEKRGLLGSIKLNKVIFSTKSVKEAIGKKSKHVEANFALDGEVHFNKWPTGFAIFESDEKIEFRDLGIKLDFDLFGGKAKEIKLDFWPGGFSLDFGQIGTLKGLLGKLPIKFDRFEWWPDSIDFPKLGYFRLPGGRPDTDQDDPVKFGLSFNLDLGSLGKLSEVLGKFRMKILVGFGYDPAPKFALGFKLENNGGAGLDIGIGNVFRIQADGYDYATSPGSDPDKVYFIYALNARLKVFDQRIPPDKSVLNLFLFLNPNGGNGAGRMRLGWFAVLTSVDKKESKAFAIPLVAIGQRVDPFKIAAPNTVRGIIDAVQNNFGDLDTFKDDLEARPPNIKKITDFLVDKIHFDPDRDWSAALRIEIAKIIGLDLVLRDPDLYGAYLRFGPKDSPLIELDILYRKLSADLGLYAADIIPPPLLRRIEMGAATITLPIVHLDIYTDGGFNVDVGFPHKRNFERSFGVEIIPYTGAGGFYFGRLSGPGAKLVPQKLLDGDEAYKVIFRYDPVTQLGFGARVGLGKRIELGPFRAELTVTVYAFLEGAQGRLRVLDPGRLQGVPNHLLPAATYSVISGAVGIMGELKGTVEFPLIRCEIMIVVYAEIGLLVRTDDHVRLHIEAGVRVSVRVVIARIEFFGGSFEISVSFAFSATIRHETISGSRRAGFEQIYQFGPEKFALASARAAVSSRSLEAFAVFESLQAEIDRWAETRIDWTTVPSLAELELAERIVLAPWFVPDITVGEELDAAAGVVGRLHTVFNLYLADDNVDQQGSATPVERWMWANAAWLLFAGLHDHPEQPIGNLLDWRISLDMILDLRARLALRRERHGVEGLPRYDEIAHFFRGPVQLAIKASTTSATPRQAAFFPMPFELALLRRFEVDGSDVHDIVVLRDRGVLTPQLEAEIEDHFDALKAIEEKRKVAGAKMLADVGEPLAKEIFEEHTGHVMRELVARLEEIFASAEAGVLTVRDALNRLKAAPEAGVPSPARSIAAMTGRFFQHGLAFPKPVGGWESVRSKIPADLADLIGSTLRDALPLYRYASLQLPVSRVDAAGGLVVANAVGIRQVDDDSWFTLTDAAGNTGEILYTLATKGPHSVTEVARAAGELPALVGAQSFKAELQIDRRELRKGSPAAFRRALDSQGEYLFGLPSELVGTDTKPDSVTLELRESSSEGISIHRTPPTEFDATRFRLALAVEIGLKGVKIPGQNAFLEGVYELSGAREYERLLLDRLLEPGDAAPAGSYQHIEHIGLFLIAEDGESCMLLGDDTSMVQTNLSVDIRPPTVAAVQALAAEPSFSARMDSPRFAEFIRRAAIVNSGGFWLCSSNETLSARIKDAEGEGASPSPADQPVTGTTAGVRVLLVVTYSNAVADLSAANALRVGHDPDAAPGVAGLATFASDFNAGGRTPVVLSGTERARDPLPGTLPLVVKVRNPARLYPSPVGGAVGATFEELAVRALEFDAVPVVPSPVIELATRFNLLEYEISDGGDKVFRQTRRADMLPVGDAEPTDSAHVSNTQSEELTFRMTLPLHRLTLAAAACTANNPYDVVGKRVEIKFAMRDIYGNSLPVAPKFADGGVFAGAYQIPYLDTLIAPGDLPHVALIWDAAAGRNIKITLSFSPEGLWAGLGDDRKGAAGKAEVAIKRVLPAEFLTRGPEAAPEAERGKWHGWAEQIAVRCVAAAERYQLATYQLDDAAALDLETTLAPSRQALADPYEPAQIGQLDAGKSGLRAFYIAAITWLSTRASEIRVYLDNPEGAAWMPLNSAVFEGSMAVHLPDEQTALFVEAQVALVIRRNRIAGEDDRMLRARTSVPPSFAGWGRAEHEEIPVVTFAAAVVRELMPGHRAALGAPAEAGRKGEALWFVAASLLPHAATPADGTRPGYYGLPPMRNAPAAFTYDSKAVWPNGGIDPENRVRVNLLDVDADAYARNALQMVEDLLEPRAIKVLISSEPGIAVLDAAVNAKERLAPALARGVQHIFADAQQSKAPSSVEANLADRFRRTLSSAYVIDTVLTYSVLWQQAPLPRPGEEASKGLRPILYGKLSFAGETDPNHDISLDIGSLSLPSEPGSRESTLHVVYDSTSGKAVDRGRLGPYLITHIQRIPRADVAAHGKETIDSRYRGTQWLKLVEAVKIPLSQDGKAQTEIPVVLRKLPERPRITNHAFVPALPVAGGTVLKLGDLPQAREWLFDLGWSWNAANYQDELEITIEYKALDSVGLFGSPDQDLSSLLTGFVVALQEIWPKVLDDIAAGRAIAPQLLDFIAAELGRLQLPAVALAMAGDAVLKNDKILVKATGGAWAATWMSNASGNDWKADPHHHIPDMGAHVPSINQKAGQLYVAGIDILRFAQGHAQLDLYRNRGFNMLGQHMLAADAFVYRMGGIRGGDPVSPRIRRDEVFRIADTVQSLSAHLSDILDRIFLKKEEVPSPIYDLDIVLVTGAVSIGRPDVDAEGVAVLPRELVPSGITMPRILGLVPGGDAARVSSVIEAWLTDQAIELPGPTAPPDRCLRLGIRIYRNASGAEGAVPILEIPRIELPLRLII